MASPDAVGRSHFRAFPLDGALLFFRPDTGESVRIENERTQEFTRRAPRVVMFGITNRCNLRCSFCSRDTARESTWTVESAAAVLRGLAKAGALEVAFGGGEPFAFRGFAELVSELHRTTLLALNVTTNGTLVDARTFASFRGLLGQVRLSIYDDPRWRDAARTLTEAGQLWGANLLVSPSRLAALPALFAELAALGCHDVSLLGHVGGDPSLQLDPHGRERLDAFIADAPLPCRISVCFGDRLASPRLFDGADGSGDCGAGYDFVTITPDRFVQSCSFQSKGEFANTAERVLDIWRERRTQLRRPSERVGCARRLPLAAGHGARRSPPKVAALRAFSGNNSGECILVGKFESSAAAERYLAELRATWTPDGEYSSEWQALFDAENVTLSTVRDSGEPLGNSPNSLLAVGRSVIALSYDSGDAFPELRALTWKRGGFVVAGGIHLHESPSLLAAIRCRDESDVRTLASRDGGLQTFPHGDLLFVRIPGATDTKTGPLEEHAQRLLAFAGDRPLGAEIVLHEWDDGAFMTAKQRLGVELRSSPRLAVGFYGVLGDAGERAARFAEQLTEATTHVCSGTVLVEGLARRKRAAVLALRSGAGVHALDGTEVVVQGWFWFLEPNSRKGTKAPPPPTIDLDALDSQLSSLAGRPVVTEAGPSYRSGARTRVTTDDPASAFRAMTAIARQLGTQLNAWVSEVAPMDYTLRRLIADVQ